MFDVLTYLATEVKSGRLHKNDAIQLLDLVRRARTGRNGVAMLHPLLQRNTSDLEGQRFSSTLSGEAFYLSDHVVNGRKVLPGVAYLEMARAAVERSAEWAAAGSARMSLQNVVWVQPVVVSESREIHIGVYRNESDEIEFEIYSAAAGSSEDVIHTQGRAVLTEAGSSDVTEVLDLSVIRSQCEHSIEAASCYAAFSAMGLEYGPAHRGLNSVQVGRDSAGQRFILAQVTMPASVAETQDQYVLHPSVMDCALQATMGMSLADRSSADTRAQLSLPFALERLQIFERSPVSALVVVRRCKASTTTPITNGVQKLDIDICDEAGRVCVRMQGFTSRVLSAEEGVEKEALGKQTLLFTPQWESKALIGGMSVAAEYGERWVCVESIYKERVSALETGCPGVKWAVLSGEASSTSLGEDVIAAGDELFARVQGILQSKPKQAVLVQVVVGTDSEHGDLLAVSGLLRSASQENPKFLGQVLALPRSAAVGELLAAVEENASEQGQRDSVIRYASGTREVLSFRELIAPAQSAAMPWKDDGVYLITGGAGGLGLIFAREIARCVQGARIILTGRSELSAATQAQLDELSTLKPNAKGAHLEYRVMDVSDGPAVVRCVHSLVEHYGSLNGIIHSAGVIRDNFIYKKTAAEFAAVLAPKVAGTINLDRATQDVELDFLVLFSSLAGVFGNVGQSDYAMANAFMDRYAAHRNELVRQGKRYGKTVSINWPLWSEGGMSMDEATQRALRGQGFDTLTTADGIAALIRAWASDASQVMVVSGERRKVQALVGMVARRDAQPALTDRKDAAAATRSAAGEATAGGIDTHRLLEKVCSVLVQTISQQLKVKLDDIDVEAELSEFGFDSISLTAFGNLLNQTYELTLSPTIFFEHPTVQRFAEYLATDHKELMAEKLGLRQPALTDRKDAAAATRSAAGEATARGIDTHRLLEKVCSVLVQTISQQLKVKLDDIDVEAELSEFGFDSISLTAFGNLLNQTYELTLSPTIFFEHPTVQRFAEYLATDHKELMAEKLGIRASKPVVEKSAESQVSAPLSAISVTNAFKRRRGRGSQPTSVAQITEKRGPEAIAIIGMSGRFPGAKDIDAFWENLKDGKDSITEIPKDRWDWRAIYGDPNQEAQKTNIKWGGFIEGVGEFDPLFFNISPREAESMDPQQRLLMTYTWQAIEDAGYSASSLSESQTAIFVGTGSSGYSDLVAQANISSIEGHSSTSGVPSIGPNRMSYFLNFHGPSEPIETACSSSLVAIHRAVRAIQSGDCEQALVGGINTIITTWGHVSFSKAGMLCEDGRCKTFSKDANGYVRSEGVGMLFLKKLPAAERDGDHIYGLIKGSAENHGGRANSLTAPNPKAQAELIKSAYREAKIDPRSVTYIETHGTGTPLGDPIEINGLKSAFADLYADWGDSEVTEAHCGLGSVKTNIGHLELAAGVAGVIKVLLQLKHQTLVKSLHCTETNPYIQLQDSAFYIVNEARPWQAQRDSEGRTLPRRAGVSSFGFGGVNAHVIIEEYCEASTEAPTEAPSHAITPEQPALIVLSAKDEERLREQAQRLLAHTRTHKLENIDLINIAYTLQVGRDALEHRLAFTASSIKALQEQLTGYLDGISGKGEITGCYVGQVKREKETLSLFNADAELQDAIRKWVDRGKHANLLELWVKGLVFDWRQLYVTVKPKRISLPTYPFARERYWVRQKSDPMTVDRPLSVQSVSAASSTRLYGQNDAKPAGISLTALSSEIHRAPERVAGHAPAARLSPLSSPGDSATAKQIVVESVDSSQNGLGDRRMSLDSLTMELTESLASLLFLERADIDVDTAFVELGLDSIIGVDWVHVLNKRYGTTMPASRLYDYPSIAALAGYLANQESYRASRPRDALLSSEILGAPERVAGRASAARLSPLSSLGDSATAKQMVLESVDPSQNELEDRRMSLDSLTMELTESLASLLFLERADVDVDAAFVELGLDSIIGVDWVHVLNKRYGTTMPASRLYDYPNIATLADYLASQQSYRASRPRDASLVAERQQSNDELTSALIDKSTPFESAPFVDVSSRECAEAQEHASRSTVLQLNASDLGSNPRERREELGLRQSPGAQGGIAIIGMSGAFPKSKNLTTYWDNIAQGRDCVSEIPSSRWSLAQYYDPIPETPGKTYCKWMGLLEEMDRFDPLFFNISPAEAETMDPQQRVFLEHSWSCIEEAGINPRTLSGSRCGVYVGCGPGDYSQSPDGLGFDARSLIGNSSAILSARLSYFLNLKGPCLAIDTACSSSLVAIAEACDSLLLNRSDLALAGGVCVLAGPGLHIMTSKAGMLSKEGRCFTFDARADGFVPGEGVGVLLMKRLADAVRDKDYIHGVIRGWGVNHDGKTNGMTAPSVNSQILLAKEVYERFEINPDTISLVEAHGTGTKLGDPIEVEALTEAFRSYTDRQQYCALGSGKSSIGHLLAAAGVAGILKVLLALRHRMLPPTTQFESLNEHVVLDGGAFYINQALKPWETYSGKLRRAAVSSFGFSGTNAHAVIEEYCAPRLTETPAAALAPERPALIVLSARNESQLKDQATQLRAHLQSLRNVESDLASIAYTLQVGRQAMEHRLALIATTPEQVIKALNDFGEGIRNSDLFQGKVGESKEGVTILAGDEDVASLLATWIRKKKLKKLGQMWVRGLDVDWRTFYAANPPRRVSLPTYPFARERYWWESSHRVTSQSVTNIVLHPLVQRNTSDLDEQRFSSTFSGAEFYLSDHLVGGSKVLPGVCYLEMARVAVTYGAAESADTGTVITLEDVAWVRPFVVSAQREVHIALKRGVHGEIEFETYTGGADAEEQRLVHAQGRAVVVDASAVDAEPLDLSVLRSQCHQSIDIAQCYSAFSSMGLEYGHAHRGLTSVQLGTDAGGQRFVLAHVSLPHCVSETRSQYVLHPSVLDSALQAAIGFELIEVNGADHQRGAGSRPALPFELKQIQILAPSPVVATVVVRQCKTSSMTSPMDGIRKLDIDLCDESGRVCIRLRGFTSRALAGKLSTTASFTDSSAHVDCVASLAFCWEALVPSMSAAWPAAASAVLLIGGTREQQHTWQSRFSRIQVLAMEDDLSVEAIAEGIQAAGGIDHIVWLAPKNVLDSIGDESLIEAQAAGVVELYRLIKALLSQGYGMRSLGFSVVTWQAQAVNRSERIFPAHASVHGLVGSLAKEYESWNIRLVDVPLEGEWPLDEMLRLSADPQGNAWAYRAGEWYRQVLLACELPSTQSAVYRDGGVYVVIGGAGGLGEVFSEHLIKRYKAQMVWIGRREMNADIEAKIARLAAFGPAPTYIRADAADHGSLEQAYQTIKAQHGKIHGVVHAAIELLDMSLARMDELRFTTSLAAKVDVSVRIAQVFSLESLDFVVFFSSLQSFSKAAGQSNYAAGCTFADSFAHQLAHAWACPVKVMNWGYWGSVGIVASEGYRTRMLEQGIGSIEPEEGMAALDQLLSGPMSQLAFVKAVRPRVLSAMGVGEERIVVAQEWLPAMSLQLPRERELKVERTADDVEKADALDRLMGRVLLCQLQTLGLFTEARLSLAAWKQQIKLPALYERWLDESVRNLISQGYLANTNDGYRVSDSNTGSAEARDSESVWAEWDERKEAGLADTDRSAQLRIVDATLRALPEILTGKRPATDILFPNSSMELVAPIYKHNRVAEHFNGVVADMVLEFVKARLKQDGGARLRILEIGAGTGGTSEGVFNCLKVYESSIAEYCYTDLSKAFLLHAEQTYGPTNAYLTYRLFDAEQPVEAQGIELGAYDVVIAANVLHATKNIRGALRNTKALLKRHGVLLLNEIGSRNLFSHLTFGLLEGWWLYEDAALRIPGTPALASDTWQRVLEGEGFASIVFPASAAHELGQQVIVAASDGVIRQMPANSGTDKIATDTNSHGAVPKRNGDSTPEYSEFTSKQPISSRAVSIHESLGEYTRLSVREIVGNALKMESALVRDAVPFSDYGVDSIVAVGLIRRINEKLRITLPTTALFDYHTVERLAKHIVEVHGTAIEAGSQGHPFGAKQGIAEKQLPATTELRKALSPRRAQFTASRVLADEIPLTAVTARRDRYHRIVINGPGSIDDLEIVETEVPALGESDVQISVRAFSLNFSDLLCVSGLYPNMPPFPFTPGVEISGIVVAVGAAVSSVRLGDAVVAIMGEMLGGQATLVTCDEGQVFQKPQALSFEESCALPAVAITMIDAFRKADLRRGESILIQTATGGTGLMAVQLAKHYGAKIFATAGSQRKLDYLQSIGVSHCINYLESDFEKEIRNWTSGKGVDVVINTLSGDAIQKGLNCLSAGGRYIEIAMTALQSAKSIDLSVLRDNQAFFSVDLRRLGKNKPEVLAQYRREMLDLIEDGVIHPVVGHVISFTGVKDAYRRLANRENIGKVVVSIPDAYRFSPILVGDHLVAADGAQASGISHREPIAIIGVSGRFAKADTVDELWTHLANATELTEKVFRWDLARQLIDIDLQGKGFCDQGGFLQNIEQFDALFFSISGLEATYMDPQQRLFLEESWKALENAGYAGKAMEAHRCGVYVGCTAGDYSHLFGGGSPAQAFWGNAASVIPARVSYYLNMHGPAIAVDTACSSSLVAMHLACQSLWDGQIELALAGGVHLQCTSEFYVAATRAGMLSRTGRCYAFDDRADGFVPCEGVGVAVLKRLSDAVSKGDHICGVIRGSGVNQDGATNGITAPSALSQERLMREVYEKFGISAESIQMMEAHGTGTELGDPIEYRALDAAFRKDTEKKHFCAIGSIKTNIGHAATAAGIAGVVKVLLALKHKQIPPTLHYAHGNSHIDFENSSFFVNTVLRPWEVAAGSKRCAAVSSFGFSGTNAHMVIEEAPITQRMHLEKPSYLIALSARSAVQLKERAERLVRYCKENESSDCGNISFTLLLGRKHFDYRLAFAASSTEELRVHLIEWLEKGKSTRVAVSEMHGQDGREKSSLRRYGNQCIEECRRLSDAREHLERMSTLADLYVQGYELEFERLFLGDQYSRIPLPTYPFAKERFWVEENGKALWVRQSADRRIVGTASHPSLQSNTSDLSDQRFNSQFNGDGPFISDKVDLRTPAFSAAAVQANETEDSAVYFTPRWDVVAPPPCKRWPTSESRMVMVGGTAEQQVEIRRRYAGVQWIDSSVTESIDRVVERIGSDGVIDHVIWIAPQICAVDAADEGVIRDQAQGVLFGLRLIKTLLQLGYEMKELGWTVVTWQAQCIHGGEQVVPAHASIYGLIGALAKEYSQWNIRLVDVPLEGEWPLDEMLRLSADPQGNAWAYRAGEWYRQVLLACELPSTQSAVYRDGGVYVVIGGAGGLGEVFSEHLIKRYKAQMVWIGRREMNADIEAKIARLAAFGPAPTYIRADAADHGSLEQAYQTIKAQHGKIHGVVHAAIELLDMSLARMDELRFTTSLAAKVDVSVRIAQVFSLESLDFVVFFSSLQSFSKAAGQSNYAAGCTFADSFAHQLAHAWACPVKVMNWGYWGSVGIVASEGYRTRMLEQGIGSIEPEEGMAALDQLLSGPMSQLAFVKAVRPRVLSAMGVGEERIVVAQEWLPAMSLQLPRERELKVERTADDVEKADALDRLMGRVLLCQLQTLGLFTEARLSLAAWKQQIKLPALYERWLDESVRNLISQGYLANTNDGYRVSDSNTGSAEARDSESVWAEWDERKEAGLADTDRSAQLRIVDATLRALPEILTGKRPATDILFPNSSMELVAPIYKHNRVAEHFNGVVADMVLEFVKARLKQDGGARLRILEIGAGTGGTSEGVFNCLKVYESSIAEYCYTDLSKAFLLHAEQTYGPTNAYLTYRLFDAEQPVEAQGIELGAYDVVIAANVLHATKNIRGALRNTKALLKRHGVLLLNEIGSRNLFSHLTFGLLEGWWLYEDAALRIPGTPALASDTWQRVLEGEGFASIVFPASAAHELGQQVIVAASDGVIRQKQGISQEPDSHKRLQRQSEPSDTVREMTVPGSIEEHVRQGIAKEFSSSLRIDVNVIDPEKSFADYGLDSILGVQTARAISAFLSIELRTASLFDYPSVNRLTAYIVSTYASSIADKFARNDSSDAAQYSDTTSTESLSAIAVQTQHKSRAGRTNGVAPGVALTATDSEAVVRDPIAIIGLSGRYASANTVDQLWERLVEGQDLTESISRWNLSPRLNEFESMHTRAGFMLDIDQFDPMFFNISGIEATYMDPQQRIFLEECWKALEDAGYAGSILEGQLCGVYVGCAAGDYAKLFQNSAPPQAMWGAAAAITPARISYYLNLHGPAIAVDTACSSSLVTAHLACQGLWARETQLALAGGIALQCTPGIYLSLIKANMLSPTGRCHVFDDRADGFVPGEGVGVLVLKRFSDALADGDHIHGVIRGSAINQDGTTNGITAPSAISQERLEQCVYERFNINPNDIQMVEAHGTGTKLGDPIEFRALTQSFRRFTDKKNYCAIGSIKTNVGHTLAAAGVAGITKVLLALKHRQIPASLHYSRGNSQIDFENSPFFVNTTLREWRVEGDKKRCAAVSSFGFSGTNAHLVVEEPPVNRRIHSVRPGYLLVLSARSAEQLKTQAEQLVSHCTNHGDLDCGNISHTLLLGRKHFNHRLACVARSINELTNLLSSWLRSGSDNGVYVSASNQNTIRNRVGLQSYGNQCIDECSRHTQGADYLMRLSTIADLYVQGCTLNFDQLFDGDQFSRVSLPTYPFARERYWVESSMTMADAEQSSIDQVPRADSDNDQIPSPAIGADDRDVKVTTFIEEWQEGAVRGGKPAKSVRKLLCCVSDSEEIPSVRAAVQSLTAETEVFFVCDRKDADASYYFEALQSVRERCQVVDTVWCLWGVKDRSGVLDVRPMVQLLQAIAAVKLQCDRLLLAVEYRTELDRCYAEAWIGLARSLKQVLPRLQAGVICVDTVGDVVGTRTPLESKEQSLIGGWARLLLLEQNDEVESVLYQVGRRHVLRSRPLVVNDAKVASQPLLRRGGTYLITGGLGGLGFVLASHLAKNYSARLILTGRSQLDDGKQTQLKVLETLGAQAMYIAADVSDLEQMRSVVEQTRSRFREIHGVIHAAGIKSEVAITDSDWSRFETVLAPNIAGTLILDEVLGGEPLDFICYFSSTSAILGDFGSCDYAMGNRFEWAYARYRNLERKKGNRQGKAIAIAWPLWAKGGMGFNGRMATDLYLQSSGQRALDTGEGVGCFERLLGNSIEQCIVLVGESGRLFKMMGIDSYGHPRSRQGELANLTNADGVLWQLKEIVSDLLKLPRERLDVNENVVQFGFDSLGLTQFAKRLSEFYSIEIVPSIFFSHATLAALSTYLAAEYSQQMNAVHSSRSRADFVRTTHDEAATDSVYGTKRIERTLPAERTNAAGNEPIAIIGMSGRFPGSRSVAELWQVLVEGRDVVTEIPADRFDWRAVYEEPSKDESITRLPSKIASKWSGAVPGVAEFDSEFFEISPWEAELMDPRQRLLLQESFNALEDAGYGKMQLEGQKIGLFVGAEQGDYQLLVADATSVTANHDAILAARLSYFLNLRGPAMTINTACSSGLVAAHVACLSLRTRECDAVIVAGVNLMLTPQMFIGMSQSGMLSPDGKCYAFDRRANGLVPGEAVVSLVLKRLDQAERDGDVIYAVIRGSGINYDGKTNGLMAPSGVAQTELVKEVHARALLDPRDIQYIVAHGTGTRLGDPVEVNALRGAFNGVQQDEPFCALTSTKSNLGHTFAASGLVSLVSLVQAMRHEMIPASLHCEQLSDYIDWKRSPFYVNAQNRRWPSTAAKPRLGAVSAFGMSGTNAHMVVESYDPVAVEYSSVHAAPYYLLTLSAKTEAGLQQRAQDLITALKDPQRDWRSPALASLSHTLLNHRQHFSYRCAMVIEDREQALHMLEKVSSTEKLPALLKGKVSHDFVEQPMLLEYAADLLNKIEALQADSHRYQQTLAALGDVYCQGYRLNWQALYGDHPPKRISLPTYPFSKERYWCDRKRVDSVVYRSMGERPRKGREGRPRTLPRDSVSSLFDELHRSECDVSEFVSRLRRTLQNN